jgi:hypothetical protein
MPDFWRSLKRLAVDGHFLPLVAVSVATLVSLTFFPDVKRQHAQEI